MITYLPSKNQKPLFPIFLFPPNITFPSFPLSVLWVEKIPSSHRLLPLNYSLNLTPCIKMRAWYLLLCRIRLCTHLGATLAQVGTEPDFVSGGTGMHKMQYSWSRMRSQSSQSTTASQINNAILLPLHYSSTTPSNIISEASASEENNIPLGQGLTVFVLASQERTIIGRSTGVSEREERCGSFGAKE